MIEPITTTCSCTDYPVLSRGAIIWRAILTVILGLLLLFRPLLTVSILTIIIGVLLIVDGIRLIAAGIRVPGGMARTCTLITGILTILLGVLAAMTPLLMDLAWIMLLGAWLILDAIGDFRAGFHAATGRGRIVVSAFLSLILGILLVIAPLLGLQAINSIVGVLLLIYGVLLFFTGITAPADATPVP